MLTEFFEDCRLSKTRLCFFAGIPPLIEEIRSHSSTAKIQIGTQPCWNLKDWEQTILSHPSLKEQLRRAQTKGVVVREYSTAEAENCPELKLVLESWLAKRGLPPLHFLVEPETLDFLTDRRTFVAELNGTPIAFLNLCPIAARNGWLTEQFPRLSTAPNGTVELMLHTAAVQLAEEGYEFLTMGLIPFSKSVMASPLPWWLRAGGNLARAYGKRFYNFQGLEVFKSKFKPHFWETVYAVVPEPKIRPIHIIAIAQAFTQKPLLFAFGNGLLRAIKMEIRWLFPLRRVR